MNFIDILILIISIGGLIYFFIDHIKYTNINVYYQKRKRLSELEEEIYNIKLHKKETEILINNINFDIDFDNSLTDKLIKYREDTDKLKILYIEYNKLDSYLSIARKHINLFYDLTR